MLKIDFKSTEATAGDPRSWPSRSSRVYINKMKLKSQGTSFSFKFTELQLKKKESLDYYDKNVIFNRK